MKRYPDFFIVGAQKAGTTTIFTQLDRVEEIFFPTLKEPHFFLSHPVMTERQYLDLYRKAENRKAGDASTLYLYDAKSSYLIGQKSPNAKIIISLRDPVERMFSAYLMFSMREKSLPSFDSILNNPDNHYVKNSMYHVNVKRFIDVFGTDNVNVIFFEQFIRDQNKTLNNLLKFLDISKRYEFSDVRENAYMVSRPILGRLLFNRYVPIIGRRLIPSQRFRYKITNSLLRKKAIKPDMTELQRHKAYELFVDDITKLENLLGMRLMSWHKQ